MHSEPNAASRTPTHANWTPFPARFQFFHPGKIGEQLKLHKGWAQKSVEGSKSGRFGL